MKKMVKGELTAFLSLIFLLLISLVGAVLESASIQVMKNERRADASRAIESVFAEYQRDLFERYKIFAIEGSYETGSYSESDILNRLSYYGAENMDLEIQEIQYLTDQMGGMFYEQAVQYEKEKMGVDKIEDLFVDASEWEAQENKYEVYEENLNKTSTRLSELLQKSEEVLPVEENPIQIVSDLKTMSIWSLLLPKEFTLSEKSVSLSELVSGRTLREGNWGESVDTEGAIFFNLYLMEHFGNALERKDKTALDYELEYLLAGKMRDKDNLEIVLRKICNLRFGINYIYLLSDSEKQAEARVMATSLCSLLTVPGITELVTQSILLAWAYGEALIDVKTLVSGKKVNLIKTKSNWKLSLENLLNLGKEGELKSGENENGGMEYAEYLQMMLYAKGKKVLRMRGLDLIEQNIKLEHEFFQVDECITALKIQADCKLRRGAGYRFTSEYQYR